MGRFETSVFEHLLMYFGENVDLVSSSTFF
jgi:hypothetical protein